MNRQQRTPLVDCQNSYNSQQHILYILMSVFFCLSSFWCWYQFLCYNVLFQWVTDQLNEPMALLLACHFIAEVWCSHYIALRSWQIKYSMVQLYVS